MAITPEQRDKVLADFSGKKFKTATDLAKAHGLSRSCVYRILTAHQKSKEVERESQSAPKRQAPTLVVREKKSRPEPVREES
jgi:hypothetical protein